MPYKSDKQRKFFHAAEERGEMPHKVVKEFDAASKGMKLPEKGSKHEADHVKGPMHAHHGMAKKHMKDGHKKLK